VLLEELAHQKQEWSSLHSCFAEFAFLTTSATEMRQIQFAFVAREASKAACVLLPATIFGLAVSSLFVSVHMR